MWGILGIILWFGAGALPPLFKPVFGLYKVLSKRAGNALLGFFGVSLANMIKFLVNTIIWFGLIAGVLVINGIAIVLAKRAGKTPTTNPLPEWKDYFPQKKKEKSSHGASAH